MSSSSSITSSKKPTPVRKPTGSTPVSGIDSDAVASEARERDDRCLLARTVLLARASPARRSRSQGQTFQEPDAFLSETFCADVPEPQLLDVTAGDAARTSSASCATPIARQRLRYWRDGSREPSGSWRRSARTGPITVGLVVSQGAIETIRVLIYRESRRLGSAPRFLHRLSSRALTLDGRAISERPHRRHLRARRCRSTRCATLPASRSIWTARARTTSLRSRRLDPNRNRGKRSIGANEQHGHVAGGAAARPRSRSRS